VSGKELRILRRRLKLTQAALAERLGVVPNTVARWERDELPIREPMARLLQLLSTTSRSRKRRG
jgi:transcriptional regulator with XRE-family HTH domain